MRVTNAVPCLVSMALLAMTACEAQDPVAVQSADRTTVHIDGPSAITQRDTYTWTAIVHGTDSFSDDDFEWTVSWLDSEEPPATYNGRILALDADPRRGRIELSVTLRSNGRTAGSGYMVVGCGDQPFAEDTLIPECRTL